MGSEMCIRDSFNAIDFFEQRNVPFIIGLNQFDGAPSHSIEDIREALDLDPSNPIVRTDARSSDLAIDTLVQLLSHILTTLSNRSAAAAQAPVAAAPAPADREAPVVTNDMRNAAASALASERTA